MRSRSATRNGSRVAGEFPQSLQHRAEVRNTALEEMPTVRSQTTVGSWAWQNARNAARAPSISWCCTCLRAVATASVNGAFPTNTPLTCAGGPPHWAC